MHLSGRLRDRSLGFHNVTDNSVKELLDLMDEAAETLDDAHEEWLEQKLMALRRLKYDV